MGLGENESLSILSFCGGKPARVLFEQGQCVVEVESDGEEHRFEGATAEQALRAAADAGLLRRPCVEKQIAFWSKHAEGTNDAITRVLVDELGVAAGWDVAREIAARVARPLPQVAPAEMGDVASAAEIALGLRLNARDAGRVARRVLAAGQGARFVAPASLATRFELARRIAQLVHETQRERGTTAMFLGSAGERFAAELGERRAKADRRIADLDSFVAATTGWPAELEPRIGALRAVSRDVGGLRAKADARLTSPHAVIDAYSELNASLLQIIDVVAAGTPDQLRAQSVAFTALIWAKENAARERAQLAMAFAQDRFEPGQAFVVGSLLGAQENLLRLFATAAPHDIAGGLSERLAAPPLHEVRRLESIALSRPAGFGVDPAHWYEAMSRKVDLMGEVGDTVTARIVARAG
jgi:hypothetical protein